MRLKLTLALLRFYLVMRDGRVDNGQIYYIFVIM